MKSWKGKSSSQVISSWILAKLTQPKTILSKLTKPKTACLLLAGIAFIVYTSHRYASYKMNTREWVKAPINDIPRECPPPDYPVLKNASNLKICMTTLTDAKKGDVLQKMVRWRNFDSLLEMTWPNKLNYVQKHGYWLFNESDSLDTSRPPSWSKIRAARRLLNEENCDWVFWLDADTVIMNSEKKIENFLPAEEGKDLLITIQKGGSYNGLALFMWLLEVGLDDVC